MVSRGPGRRGFALAPELAVGSPTTRQLSRDPKAEWRTFHCDEFVDEWHGAAHALHHGVEVARVAEIGQPFDHVVLPAVERRCEGVRVDRKVLACDAGALAASETPMIHEMGFKC